MIIPPTGNEFIAMMKDTALVSFLGVTAASAEVFRRSQLVGKADFKNLEAYVAAALVFWGLTVLFTFFQARLERSDRPGLRPRPRRASHAGASEPAARRRRGRSDDRTTSSSASTGCTRASATSRWCAASTWRSTAARSW